MRARTLPALPVGPMATLVAVGLILLAGAAPAAADTTAADTTWRDLLQRAMDEGRQRPFEGRLVVVTFEASGPAIGEVTVAQDGRGTLMTSRSASWLFGQQAGRTFFGDEDAGTLLRLGSVDSPELNLERLAERYEVRTGDRAPTAVGEATVLEVTPRGEAGVRERLYVDPGSGLLVRRETYGGDGVPVRLVAFTSLDLTPGPLPDMASEGIWREVRAARTEMSQEGLEILREVGWMAPRELPGGFEVVDASALGEGEGSSLHLLYTDGLYAISVYEQHGRLDGAAAEARGARPATLGDMHVYRWPGAEPVTVAWTGADRTFTAMSDAPPDVLTAALGRLPHDPPPGVAARLRRGLERVGYWLWPFG